MNDNDCLRPTLICAPRPDEPGGTCPPLLPMDCTTLRMMAAWAGALPNQRVEFVYNGDPETSSYPTLSLFNPFAQPKCGVSVPSYTRARRADMASIDCTVNLAGGTAAPLSVTGRLVAAVTWDCAFWSESAVEKFVVPYVAMLGGPQAQAFLDKLLLAWNGYPAERLAFGLLRRGAAPRTPSLDLCSLFDVAYVDVPGRSISTASLREFLDGCTPPPVPAEIPVPCWRCEPGGEPATLPDQLSLRRLAEWVSACRDELFLFSFDTARGQFWPMSQPGCAPLVIGGFTPRTRADRPAVQSVTLRSAAGGEAVLAPDVADAVFWGSGSVNHVMLPYYASVYGGQALQVLSQILDVWNVPADGPGTASLAADPAVYALVHLPKSDWDPEISVAEDVMSRVGLLVAPREPGDALQVRSFSDYRADAGG